MISPHLTRRQWLFASAALGCAAPPKADTVAPATPRIDAHQHFWTYSAENYSWIDPASVVARDFGPADLAPLLEAGGVDGTICVEARSQVAETEALLAFAAQARFVRGVVGWLPLVDAGVGGLIERYASDRALRGLRHAILAEPDPDFMLRPDFNAGIGRLERAGLRFDLLLAPGDLSRAPAFVDRHPHQIFVLDHLAKPFVREQKREPWATELRELARRPNVYCKLSGLVNEADHRGWTPADLRPYLDIALEAFTPQRLMFGSDWPMCLVATTYPQWLATAHTWAAALSSDEQQRIFGATALEAYGV
jgi:L-fuconolactonase